MYIKISVLKNIINTTEKLTIIHPINGQISTNCLINIINALEKHN